MRITIFLLIILMLLPAPAAGQDAPPLIRLPEDHGLHTDIALADPNRFIEWHYFTGLLNDRWGYQVTLFTGARRGVFGVIYDIAISDLNNSRFWHYRRPSVLHGAEGVLFDDGIFRLEALPAGDWQVQFAGEMEHLASGDTMAVALDVTLRAGARDYVLHGDAGLEPMGACAEDRATLMGWSYYYSNPRLETSGTLTLDDATHTISGQTWFDHQWGNFQHCELAWNWFSLRLDDGRDLMIFQHLDPDGSARLTGGTIMHPDGSSATWTFGPDETLRATRVWDTRGVTFPISWEVRTREGSFGVEPIFDDQTPPFLDGLPIYWEGVVRVRQGGLAGPQIGWGYLEVVPN